MCACTRDWIGGGRRGARHGPLSLVCFEHAQRVPNVAVHNVRAPRCRSPMPLASMVCTWGGGGGWLLRAGQNESRTAPREPARQAMHRPGRPNMKQEWKGDMYHQQCQNSMHACLCTCQPGLRRGRNPNTGSPTQPTLLSNCAPHDHCKNHMGGARNQAKAASPHSTGHTR